MPSTEHGWANEATAAVASEVRASEGIREEVAESINSLGGNDSIEALAEEAGAVVRAAINGRLADLSAQPDAADPSTQAMALRLGSVENVAWSQLGEAFLFEIASTGRLSHE